MKERPELAARNGGLDVSKPWMTITDVPDRSWIWRQLDAVDLRHQMSSNTGRGYSGRGIGECVAAIVASRWKPCR
jgi:hypothetical protein